MDVSHLTLSQARISIEETVKGVGVKKVITVNPFKYRKTVEAVKAVASCEGISVLIARAYCPLCANDVLFVLGSPKKIAGAMSLFHNLEEREAS